MILSQPKSRDLPPRTIYKSIYLSFYQSVCLSDYLSAYLSIFLSYLFFYLSVIQILYIYLSLYLSVCISIYLSIYLFFCIQGPDAANKLPTVTPHTKCRLRLLKQERIKVSLGLFKVFFMYLQTFRVRLLTNNKTSETTVQNLHCPFSSILDLLQI